MAASMSGKINFFIASKIRKFLRAAFDKIYYPCTMEIALENIMLPCLFRDYFGFDCPGCGFQRSVASLVRGEFGNAFLLYPPIYTFVLWMASMATWLIKPLKFTYKSAIVAGVAHAIAVTVAYIVKIC
jgi:hypothetical protein